MRPTVAVVGATGQVGAAMRSILEERDFPLDRVRFLAYYGIGAVEDLPAAKFVSALDSLNRKKVPK